MRRRRGGRGGGEEEQDEKLSSADYKLRMFSEKVGKSGKCEKKSEIFGRILITMKVDRTGKSINLSNRPRTLLAYFMTKVKSCYDLVTGSFSFYHMLFIHPSLSTSRHKDQGALQYSISSIKQLF